MKLELNIGLGEFEFGMSPDQIEKILGKPDAQRVEDNQDLTYQYNNIKTRFIFYSEDEFELGFIESSNSDIELCGIKLIGKNFNDTVKFLESNDINDWTIEESDFLESAFSEEGELHLFADYGVIQEVSIGVSFE